MKLELKHIVPYLPYNLKAEMLDYKIDYVGKQYDEIVGLHQWDKHCKYWSALTIGGSKPNIERIKPILKPMQDVAKYFEELYGSLDHQDVTEYFDDDFLQSHDNIEIEEIQLLKPEQIPYGTLQVLFKHRFDVFNLIGNKLAHDENNYLIKQ